MVRSQRGQPRSRGGLRNGDISDVSQPTSGEKPSAADQRSRRLCLAHKVPRLVRQPQPGGANRRKCCFPRKGSLSSGATSRAAVPRGYYTWFPVAAVISSVTSDRPRAEECSQSALSQPSSPCDHGTAESRTKMRSWNLLARPRSCRCLDRRRPPVGASQRH